MILSLCFSSIVNLGMALSNIKNKPLLTAQIAALDTLVPVLFKMQDPVTALHHDSDRVLAIGICRVFFEWFPRSWLQTSLIMAHCAQVWALPFSFLCIMISTVGISIEAFWCYSLSKREGLPRFRQALHLLVGLCAVICCVMLVVHLIA